jgi:hypothetical protein
MLTFVGAPRGFYDAIPVGPIRTQVRWVLDMIEDPARTRVSLVTSAEEMPVAETIETLAALHGRLGLATGPVFVNGLYDSYFTAAEIETVNRSEPDAFIRLGEGVGLDLDKDDIDAAVSYGRFLEARHAIQRKHLRALKRGIDRPLVELPFLFSAGLGAPDVATLADVIEARVAAL